MRLLLAMLLGLALAPGLARAEVYEGPAQIKDGDSLAVGGEEMRLEGIDAFESDQSCVSSAGRSWPCGGEATRALERKTRGQVVSCTTTGRDKYQRALAHCSLRGEDLGAWLVRGGWALAYRRYSQRYVPDEDAARRAGVGVWAGEFTKPWDWRHRGRSTAEERAPQAATPENFDCRIKGNVSKSGRVYHVPGSRDYARTKIDESKGERWFCSEAEARAAGWRAQRR